jgi:hypothetical protein
METSAPSGWKAERVSKHVRRSVKVNDFHCPEENLIVHPVALPHTSSDAASNTVDSSSGKWNAEDFSNEVIKLIFG